MRRRLVAAATLAALGLGLSIPLAWAHGDAGEHRFAWGADPATAPDGDDVSGNDELVAAAVEFIDGVKSWDVVIRPVNGGQPSTCHEDIAQQNGKYPQKIYINCPWDTTRAKNHTLAGSTAPADAQRPDFTRTWQSQDLGPSVNGKYTIEITAYNSGQDYNCGIITGCKRLPVEPHSLYQSGSNPPRWREVWVRNGVSEPTGVTNAFDATTNKLRVNWAPNPEPDVSYIVQERVGDGKWSSGAAVPGNATTYERAIEQPGKYQYRVAGVRPAPTSVDPASTKRSEYVATSAVDIAQVTPPTTAGGTNGADGTPDGGDPGVFVPTDPTSPTTAPAGAGPRASAPPRSVVRPTGRISGARPSGSISSPGSSPSQLGDAEGEGMEDDGFSATLPYDQQEQEGEIDELADGEVESMIPGAVVPRPRDTRALLIPLASGLALFVFAMQCTVVLRRRPAMNTTTEDDFGDWLGY
jgi:hypothetical protein